MAAACAAQMSVAVVAPATGFVSKAQSLRGSQPARKGLVGTPLVMAKKDSVAQKRVTVCSAEKAVAAATSAALVAMASYPEIAQAAELTPSLKNLLGSVFAGGVVLAVIVAAVSTVSSIDRVER
uniref:Photosystem II subunit X n=1 Tax=Mesostigma viride TaxID=41882 RepID=A0A7S5CEJ1_MESVI|eukprot:jgi/Mesvir1/370/Mv11266-RA.1